MIEHIHMFHLPKTLNEDPKSVRGAALQSEPQAPSGCLAAGAEQGNPKGGTPIICH